MNTPEQHDIDRSNLMYRLALLTRRWRKILDANLRIQGLTDASWRPLLYLSRLGNGICQKELAAALGIEDPSLVRLLDELAAKGLIVRTENASDRRMKRLKLTPEGHEFVLKIQDTIEPLNQRLLEDFTDDDIGRLATYVRELESNLGNFAQPGK